MRKKKKEHQLTPKDRAALAAYARACIEKYRFEARTQLAKDRMDAIVIAENGMEGCDNMVVVSGYFDPIVDERDLKTGKYIIDYSTEELGNELRVSVRGLCVCGESNEVLDPQTKRLGR